MLILPAYLKSSTLFPMLFLLLCPSASQNLQKMLRPTHNPGILFSLPITPSKLYRFSNNSLLLLTGGNQNIFSPIPISGEKHRSGDRTSQAHSRATSKIQMGEDKVML